MNSFLAKFKNIDKFFRLFGGYDYDDCCCGGSCSCCGNGHDNYNSEGYSNSFKVNFKRADVPLA